MINSLLLKYTRHFPLEFGKRNLIKFIKLPDSPLEYVNRYDAKLLLDTREYQMKQIFCHDLYEKNTVRHLVKLVKDDYTFFDVGANIGFYTLTFGKLLTNGVVQSFEPNSVSFERLERNLKLNNLDNVVLNHFGLSAVNGTVEISYNLENTGTSSAYKKSSGNQLREHIKVFTLDSYCKAQNIERIDFIKVDIEGGEFDFIIGASETISRNKKMILVVEMMAENFAEAGYSSSTLFNHLVQLGFRAYLPKAFPFGLKRINHVNEEYSDNIIFLKGY